MRPDMYQKIIENYIDAYNNFDVDRMLSDMHDNIKFENISNGDVNLVTNGSVELRNQAEQAKKLFKERIQKIRDIKFYDDLVEVEIDYKGVLAVDISEELKAGSVIEMKGSSIFRFKDNKIIELKDIS
jgi:ketosteroid isomerase-like protein